MPVVRLTVDGSPTELGAAGATSLLRALRDRGIVGPKGACEQGECGSCTVLLDGLPVCACLVPAGACGGSTVTTVAGLEPSLLAALTDALGRHAAVQCGFCTPGIVVAAAAHVIGGGAADRRSVAEALEGNLCRCTGYEGILAAVADVAAAHGGAGR